MKKSLKIVAVITILLSIFALISMPEVKAWNTTEAIKSADNAWSGETDVTPDSTIVNATKSVMATAINVIRVVGTGIALIMLTYVAIKYMTAAPQEKADFKKSATAFVVGAVVLFAASNILTIIANFAATATKPSTSVVQDDSQQELKEIKK